MCMTCCRPGANRVYYARNHDTSWFYHFNGYTRRFMALDAIHALFGIPEVFAGDPENGPHPDADPGVYGYYQKLFALRKRWPEFAPGNVLLREVECNNPWVFSGLRKAENASALGLVSLSDQSETVEFTFRAAGIGPAGELKLLDVQTGETIAVQKKRGTNVASVNLKPYQVLVGRL